jgi:zinc protease
MKSLIVTMFAAGLVAQTLDRTKVPDTPPLASFKLPPLTETTLPNGLLVVAVRDQRFPVAAARLGFRAGGKVDPKDLTGLAETAAALLKEGTKTRTSRQIAEEMASIGGALECEANPDNLVVNASALSEYLSRLLDILGDITRNAAFPEDELKLRRQNRVQELLAQRADASTLADEKLLQTIYGSHPYARMLPTADSLAKIDRAALLDFQKRFLIPNNAILVLSGALPPQDELMKMVAARFGSWQKAVPPAQPLDVVPVSKRTFTLVDRPGSVQADIRVGKLSVDRTNPDYFPLAVANGILGGAGSSRMFLHIREEKGYAYDAHSENNARRTGGYFQAVTQVRNEVVQPALEDVLAELKKISSEPVTTDELTNIKNYMAGTFVLRLETQAGLAGQLSGVKLNGLPNDYLEKYVTRVRSVEPDQVLKAAKKYLSPEDASVVVVGDAAQIAKPLEKFGKIIVEKAK